MSQSKRAIFGLVVLSLLAAFAFAGSAWADTIYIYTGSPFTILSGNPPSSATRLTGFFSVASPLPPNLQTIRPVFINVVPLTWSFTDGNFVFTASNSTLLVFEFTTNATGAINGWCVGTVAALPANPNFSSGNGLNGCFGADIVDYRAFNQAQSSLPGTWSVATPPVVTPEPTTITLVVVGLSGLMFRKRRPRQGSSVSTL